MVNRHRMNFGIFSMYVYNQNTNNTPSGAAKVRNIPGMVVQVTFGIANDLGAQKLTRFIRSTEGFIIPYRRYVLKQKLFPALV